MANNDPFASLKNYDPDSKIVLETAKYDFIISQREFMRQNIFRLEDHMYSLTAKMKNKRAKHPLVLDCLDALEKSLVVVLEKLRDFYNARNRNANERERCYIALCHKKLQYGVRVGNFNISKESLPMIANLITTRLFNFINSDQQLGINIQLDQSLDIRFVVSNSADWFCRMN